VLADALDTDAGDERRLLTRINAAHPAEKEANTDENQEFSRLRRRHHRTVD
jgi:hypothetical protein